MKFLPEEEQTLRPYYVLKHKFVGTFEANDGLIDITDPCYEEDTWCAKFGVKVKPGTYHCFVDVADFPALYLKNDNDATPKTMHDERLIHLTIVHNDYIRNLLNKEWKLLSADIGVDAGLCGFYNHKPDFTEDNDWLEFINNLRNLDKHEYITCDLRNYGITVSSGWGDGVYEVYKKSDKGEIVALDLRF